MSIRARLLLSNIAMIAIPALSFLIAAVLLVRFVVGGEPWWADNAAAAHGPSAADAGRIRTFAFSMLGTMIAVIALTGITLAVLVSRSISGPLQALRHAAERIKDGELEEEVRPVRRDEIGQLAGAFEDMRRRLLESVQQRLRDEDNRRQLIASISHDLKTPITAISACVEALRDGIADTPERRQSYYAMIAGKAGQLDAMIDELFLYSKLDMRREPFRWETVDLLPLLADWANEVARQPGSPATTVAFETPLQGMAAYVRADRDKLARILMNMTANSLRHLPPEGGRLIYRLTDEGVCYRVSVEDNGSGIAPDRLPSIFERFYRGDPSRSADAGGSGLGLAIVKQIVEGHGGSVHARSEPGVRTVVGFTLPKPGERGGAADEANSDY